MGFNLRWPTLLLSLWATVCQPSSAVATPNGEAQRPQGRTKYSSKMPSELEYAATEAEIEEFALNGGGMPKIRVVSNGNYENPNTAYKIYVALPPRRQGGWDWLKTKALLEGLCTKLTTSVTPRNDELTLLDVIFLTTTEDKITNPMDILGAVDYRRNRLFREYLDETISRHEPNSTGLSPESAYLISADIDLLRAMDARQGKTDVFHHIRKRELSPSLGVAGIEAILQEEIDRLINIEPSTDEIQRRFSEQDVGRLTELSEWLRGYLQHNPTGGGGNACSHN